MSRPMGDLSVVIVQFAISPYDNRVQLAWGGTPLIALLVLAISIGARLRFRQSSKD
ncbi:hypothetical protein [Accumulibacter sp.]|uniref:hypothetical protein n=1 Tax=Accumulibacter sp. TaxID=2053492 RepID=UPI0025E031E3|nr:hypothetical protein [Accumulibacter sp.]